MLHLADSATSAAAHRRSLGKVAVTVPRRCLSHRKHLHPRGLSALPYRKTCRWPLVPLERDSTDFRRRDSSSSTASSSPIVFVAPPEELEDGYFERPTPVLLVAGEGQPAAWWDGTASFLAARGCTVGTMPLTGRGTSPTDMLTLRALQAGVAAAVDKSGLTPPVIIAHSMAGFVCQQYLQSYSASGLVLLDSFPPSPSALANEHLLLARAGDSRHMDDPAGPSPSLSTQELAQLMRDEPARWEGHLRRYFVQLHQHSPWQDATLPRHRHNQECGREGNTNGASCQPPSPPPACGVRFPVKAFAQMCLGQPSSTLRLESHVVETLVLGSGIDSSSTGGYLASGRGAKDRTDFLVTLDDARRDGLSAICAFHGIEGWSMVNHRGLVRDDGIGDVGAGEPEGATPWQEVVWKWYDARF